MTVWKDTLQSGNTTKPAPGASTGLPIYPAFTNTDSQAYRLRRLEVGAQRQRGGAIQMSTGQYARIPANSLNIGKAAIDLTLSTVRKAGGVSPNANISGFAYTSTANSITWYWDGTHSSTVIVIHRSDGTAQVIPTAGSGLTVSGLANTTTYYFLPFWSPNQSCNVGWVTGTVGTPQIAFIVTDTTSVTSGSFYQLQQTLENREPLTSGYMTATTGSSGGGGGGGSGGTCVMSGTDIVPLGGIEYTLKVHGEREWVRLESEDGKVLCCTRNHPLYTENRGRTVADLLMPGDMLIMDSGVRGLKAVDWFTKNCSKHSVHMPNGHLFYANGYLSHNAKPFIP